MWRNSVWGYCVFFERFALEVLLKQVPEIPGKAPVLLFGAFFCCFTEFFRGTEADEFCFVFAHIVKTNLTHAHKNQFFCARFEKYFFARRATIHAGVN
jgi:hypothetical protein